MKLTLLAALAASMVVATTEGAIEYRIEAIFNDEIAITGTFSLVDTAESDGVGTEDELLAWRIIANPLGFLIDLDSAFEFTESNSTASLLWLPAQQLILMQFTAIDPYFLHLHNDLNLGELLGIAPSDQMAYTFPIPDGEERTFQFGHGAVQGIEYTSFTVEQIPEPTALLVWLGLGCAALSLSLRARR